jgi:hypothetical protein
VFAPPAARRSGRPRWAIPAAIAAVGLVASASLGYLFYSANAKLDATRHELTASQFSLEARTHDLAAEQAQAAYVKMYSVDLGRLSTDYASVVACDSADSCRGATQALLSDAQAFQSDRQAARVPAAFINVDSMLGDGLSAQMAADRDLISAISTNSSGRINTAFSEVNDAMLSIYKTESALGPLVR